MGSPLADNSAKRTLHEIVTPAAGYAIGNDAGERPLAKTLDQGDPHEQPCRAAASPDLARLERPMIVLEMKQHPDVSPSIVDQSVAGKTYPALQYRGDMACSS